jgi:hypothetical protein
VLTSATKPVNGTSDLNRTSESEERVGISQSSKLENKDTAPESAAAINGADGARDENKDKEDKDGATPSNAANNVANSNNSGTSGLPKLTNKPLFSMKSKTQA